MKTFATGRHLLGIGVATAVLCGCTVRQPGGSTPGVLPSDALVKASVLQGTSDSGDLLYVDDNGFNGFEAYVLAYTYPQGKPVARLTGMFAPRGECSDANGNVFVVAAANETNESTTIYEYAHGGTSPIATLSDPGEGLGCAIDPTTGNLAVANPTDLSNPYTKDDGDVAVFPGATGNPTMYYTSTLINFDYCGYDNNGNLYLSTATRNGYGLASLAAGSSSIESLSLNKKLYGAYGFVPSVQWDGNNMTVSTTLQQMEGKNSGPVDVYRLDISGQNATVIGTTRLNAVQNRHRGQSWIDGSTIIGINYVHGRPQITFWAYPKGGNPVREITHSQKPAASLFVGVTISVAPGGARTRR